MKFIVIVLILYCVLGIIEICIYDTAQKNTVTNCENKHKYGGECRDVETIEHEVQTPITVRGKK